ARLKQQSSAAAGTRGWGVERIICKSNDDLRQEVFIMQLIYFYLEVFQKETLDLWLQPYRILSTSKSTGLIQVLDNSISLHGLKKNPDYPGSLGGVFEQVWGAAGSEALNEARRRFAQSLAGYSVVSYLLAFKDRHNGNIMITNEGRLIHIDFGFVFGQAPGNQFSMERAHFKLTQEYVDVLGGRDSEMFKYYVEMVGQGLVAARKYATVAITLLEIMMFQSEFPCFAGGAAPRALRAFQRRLMRNLTDDDIRRKARQMVDQSLDHKGTRLYDRFQLFSNGILP
ncbi:kinase-like domain-containing protein, partial [Tribonema minus]